MKILIISFYFPPELTPRAFRTFELVKEFCVKGHDVVLILPQKPEYHEKVLSHQNLKIIYVDSNFEHKIPNDGITIVNVGDNSFKKRLNGNLFNKLKMIKTKKEKIENSLEYYFLQINNRHFIKNAFKVLKNDKETYNLLISICWPIETHIATSLALIFNKHLREIKVKVAEYSDPFSTEQTYKIFWGYKVIDFIIGKLFNYIVVPTPKAVSSYQLFKDVEHIKVIPQAFNLTEYNIPDYKPNDIITFAYAGTFYFESRNPIKFAEYLTKINIPFKFVIYTLRESYDSQLLIKTMKELLNEKIEIYFNIDRKQLIMELSRMDFLINFEYTTTNQTASKLIDYAIAKRPICSVSTSNLQTDTFNEFLNKNFDSQVVINIEDYNITKIAEDFINLL